jgi:hypothetical protein
MESDIVPFAEIQARTVERDTCAGNGNASLGLHRTLQDLALSQASAVEDRLHELAPSILRQRNKTGRRNPELEIIDCRVADRDLDNAIGVSGQVLAESRPRKKTLACTSACNGRLSSASLTVRTIFGNPPQGGGGRADLVERLLD